MPTATEVHPVAGEHVVEAIAGLAAASSVFNAMAGSVDTPLGTFFCPLAGRDRAVRSRRPRREADRSAHRLAAPDPYKAAF
jgi:hypothetical protein